MALILFRRYIRALHTLGIKPGTFLLGVKPPTRLPFPNVEIAIKPTTRTPNCVVVVLEESRPHLDVLHRPLHRGGHAPLSAPPPAAVAVRPQVSDHQVEVVSRQPPQMEGLGGGPHVRDAEPSPLKLRPLRRQPGRETGRREDTQHSDGSGTE